MPKMKTHKGIKKRIRVSSNGKIKRKRSFGGHLLSGRSPKRRRLLGNTCGMSKTMARKTRIRLGA